MPDHIHFVVHVKEETEKTLGHYIAPFTKSCSQAYTRLFNLPNFTTLFKVFDDEIIFDKNQLDRAIKYVEDNPRRYLVKRQVSDLFKRHLQLDINGMEYAAYGNIFLLKSIYLLPVRIHRKWLPQEFEEYIAYCRAQISAGAIPITPAIHKAEKDIVNMAIERGSSVILLRDLGFNERFKPQRKLFALCAEGTLLLSSPWPHNLERPSKAGYTEFHRLNDYAAAIAALPATARLSLRSNQDKPPQSK